MQIFFLKDLRSWLKDERIFIGDDGCLEVKDEILNDELVFSKVEDGPMEEFFNDGTVDELVGIISSFRGGGSYHSKYL